MIGFKLSNNTNLTLEMVEKYIELHKVQTLPRLKKNERYYQAKNDTIINRTFEDKSKPNTKIASPYASYIADCFTSYFVGRPITLNSTNKELLTELIKVDDDNSDILIGRDMSVFGYAMEMIYIDNKKSIKAKRINPQEVIPIYSTSIDEELLYCIRFYEENNILSNEITTYIEVYSSEDIVTYKKNMAGTTMVSSVSHQFKQVPITVYKNNEDCVGDFEKVIPLIDAYDLAMSDTSNGIQFFNDCYMVFSNVDTLEEEQIQAMKENRVICVTGSENGQAGVSFLTKTSNDVEMENYKNRLVAEIHKQSKLPDISEVSSKSHISPSAVRMSLLETEQVVAIKEKGFKVAKLEILQMAINILNMMGEDYSIQDLTITFNRNIPRALESMADAISKLVGIVSKETILEQLPIVNDVQLELQRLEKENELNSYSIDFEAGE